MNGIFHNHGMVRMGRRCMTTLAMVVLLSLGAGCDPCMNNPCDDGVACNGVELCSADGSGFNCSGGQPIQCEAGETCTEPDGACVGEGCASAEDCDDSDPCTTDDCDATTSECTNTPDCTAETCSCDDADACTGDACNPETGECDYTAVVCAEGETCDPDTGICAGTGTSIPQTLLDAGGTYTDSGICGDEDNSVTLTNNNGTLTLGGFSGNNDITFTLVDDITATATDVTAFGTPGHMLTLTLDRQMGYIAFDLTVAGNCSSDLMIAPQ